MALTRLCPAAFGRLRVETVAQRLLTQAREGPAAFGRLRVETAPTHTGTPATTLQPPSGGCVLKHLHSIYAVSQENQPPSGGCVLKLKNWARSLLPLKSQPPSGGCVLKRRDDCPRLRINRPAAFGRLRVETAIVSSRIGAASQPPSGGCVLKLY